MIKYVLIVVALFGFTNVYAQNASEKQILQQRIEHRDTIMDQVSKKALPDSLEEQIADYRKFTQILESEADGYVAEIQNLRNELHKFLVLTSPDTLIFNQDFKSMADIPTCLKERADIVSSIIELRTRIVTAESTAQNLEQQLGNSPIAYAAIREKIEKDLDEIQALIHKIKEMNLPSLSDEQQKYFRPGLTDRYNNFKKYF